MRNFGFSRLHFKCDTVSADPIQYLENPEDCICSLRSISFIGEELCPSCFSSMITMLSKLDIFPLCKQRNLTPVSIVRRRFYDC